MRRRARWLLGAVTLGIPLATAGDVLVVPAGTVTAGCDPALHATCRGARVEALRVDAAPVPVADLDACRAAGACAPALATPQPGCSSDAPGAAGSVLQAWAVTDYGEAAAYCTWRGGRVATELEWERLRSVGMTATFGGTEWVEGWYVVGGGGGPLGGGFAPRTRLVLTPGMTPAQDVRGSAGVDVNARYAWRCAYGAAPGGPSFGPVTPAQTPCATPALP